MKKLASLLLLLLPLLSFATKITSPRGSDASTSNGSTNDPTRPKRSLITIACDSKQLTIENANAKDESNQ